MAEVNIKKITIYIFLVFGFSKSVKFDRQAYKKLISGRSEVLVEPLPGGSNTILSKIQDAYNDRQKSAYDNVMQAASAIDGNTDPGCPECAQEDLKENSDMTPLECYAKCLGKTITGSYNEDEARGLLNLLTGTFENFICKPVGFKFWEQYFSKDDSVIWSGFGNFSYVFENSSSLPFPIKAEVWLGNLALLVRSPLYFYARSQAQVRENLIEDETIINLDNISPDDFASECSRNYARDVAPLMKALIDQSGDKPYLLDIILRGIFVLRSAYFYTLGAHTNAAGAVVEALNLFTNRKCNLINADGSSDGCDNYGHYPIPQFPIPDDLEDNIGLDCMPAILTPMPTTTTEIPPPFPPPPPPQAK